MEVLEAISSRTDIWHHPPQTESSPAQSDPASAWLPHSAPKRRQHYPPESHWTRLHYTAAHQIPTGSDRSALLPSGYSCDKGSWTATRPERPPEAEVAGVDALGVVCGGAGALEQAAAGVVVAMGNPAVCSTAHVGVFSCGGVGRYGGVALELPLSQCRSQG